MEINLRGTLAALLTPRERLGSVDLEAFERLCAFTLDRGVSGLVVGGATGGYASLSLAERSRLTELAVKAASEKGGYGDLRLWGDASGGECRVGKRCFGRGCDRGAAAAATLF